MQRLRTTRVPTLSGAPCSLLRGAPLQGAGCARGRPDRHITQQTHARRPPASCINVLSSQVLYERAPARRAAICTSQVYKNRLVNAASSPTEAAGLLRHSLGLPGRIQCLSKSLYSHCTLSLCTQLSCGIIVGARGAGGAAPAAQLLKPSYSLVMTTSPVERVCTAASRVGGGERRSAPSVAAASTSSSRWMRSSRPRLPFDSTSFTMAIDWEILGEVTLRGESTPPAENHRGTVSERGDGL